MYYIYIYMLYVCGSKEEIAASGNVAKKKRGGNGYTSLTGTPSYTHRGQPAITNHCKGQASGNADAVLQKKGFQLRYHLDNESQQGPLVEHTPQKGEFHLMHR
jgi:hypothetical protein